MLEFSITWLTKIEHWSFSYSKQMVDGSKGGYRAVGRFLQLGPISFQFTVYYTHEF